MCGTDTEAKMTKVFIIIAAWMAITMTGFALADFVAGVVRKWGNRHAK